MKNSSTAKWKIVLIVLVGMFSLNFNWYFNNPETGVNREWTIPLFPLGVGIIYLIARSEPFRWQRVRAYAWWGFTASYLFLLASFIELGLQNIFYPEDQLDTYLAQMNQAEIVYENSSAPANVVIDHTVSSEVINSATIQDSNHLSGNQMEEEKFPYVLRGVQSKWGSGYYPAIYI
ncbi:hypothetical protein MUN88_18830 [Gracilibacillus caseinilyticus]|uniref:Uncharacterized protein n=1 Tax=Gracilibacillus caseinilyticus TaxID=2932256 RepID=A0ABY4EUJ4_9BACI|nr:hypothetical protein [Gracilibacillus caseinilyticus]UOQ48084.1 hypothetical protein MUN88_18830 [Gracilibacillus caseinilyticus]